MFLSITFHPAVSSGPNIQKCVLMSSSDRTHLFRWQLWRSLSIHLLTHPSVRSSSHGISTVPAVCGDPVGLVLKSRISSLMVPFLRRNPVLIPVATYSPWDRRSSMLWKYLAGGNEQPADDVGWCQSLSRFFSFAYAVPSARDALPPTRYLILWTKLSRVHPAPKPPSHNLNA